MPKSDACLQCRAASTLRLGSSSPVGPQFAASDTRRTSAAPSQKAGEGGMMPPRKPVRLFTGLVGHPPEPISINPTMKIGGVAVSEDELRAKFGVEETKPLPKLPDSYRQTLNLDP